MTRETKYFQLIIHYNLVFGKLTILFYFIIFNLFSNDPNIERKKVLSGYNFSEPSTQEIQDDDFLNPGILWVEKGSFLWNKKISPNKSSCNSCHGNIKNMEGVSLKYPRIEPISEKLINLEQRINLCRKKMKLKEFDVESKELMALSTLISYQSRGMPFKYEVTEKNKKWYDLGKKLYFEKIGVMGLSCNQCHDDRVGLSLRAEKVSQGQINGFPSYLLRWSKVISVHKRFEFCNEQARAIPYKINSDQYNALQFYLSHRGNGLLVESPAVRK